MFDHLHHGGRLEVATLAPPLLQAGVEKSSTGDVAALVTYKPSHSTMI